MCLWGREEGLPTMEKVTAMPGWEERTLLDYLIPSYFFPLRLIMQIGARHTTETENLKESHWESHPQQIISTRFV